MFPPAKDSELELLYPVLTDVHHFNRSELSLRRVIVYRTRDLVAEPLTPAEFIRRPFVVRSRWLVRAWDVDRRAWRNFYLGSSEQYRSPSTMRIAIYEPGSLRPDAYISRQFEPTSHDRRVMLRLLQRIADHPSIDFDCVRIVADDLRLG